MEFLFSIGVILVVSLCARGQEQDFWNNQARRSIEDALALQELNIGEAKNIIFFLGDGMSVPTVTAARIRQGQLAGQTGEENSLAWDTFPHVGLIKTYNTDAQVPDSAGTATAFFCGVKTKSGVLGIDDRVEYADCASGQGGEVNSVLYKAYHNGGKATGIVSTARITHATPGALYSHSANRDWEANDDIPVQHQACKDIARQLVEDNPYIKVILGGGRQNFYNKTEIGPEYEDDEGHRTDGRNLIQEWLVDKPSARYVWNKTEFDAIDEDNTDFLLGLFEDSHMRYVDESEEGNDPSIAEMTEKAIRILEKEENGFFLAVEGGRIDHAHHAGQAYKALGEAIAMSDAVAKALEMTSRDDTLIIVTADHAHTMAIAGYPDRGNPILGLSGENGADGLPYTTIGYINGPGGKKVQKSYEDTGNRTNLTDVDTEDPDFVQDAIVPRDSESHGGDDVAVYAIGPMSHLFHGVQEQSYIAHVMIFAGCYDDEESNVCNTNVVPTACPPGAATAVSHSRVLMALAVFLVGLFRHVF